MKIVSLTMAGNESEIIESFVRYNSNFVDKMVIVSTCCIDNTAIIIRKLMAEGYNIEFIEEPVISFEQKYMDNKYMKMIAGREDMDLFIPLDADEFLTGDENPRKILESLPLDRIYEVYWKNYAMSQSDDAKEAFIPKRLKNYKVNYKGNNIPKVIIPIKMILDNNITLDIGHHGVMGENLKIEHLDKLKFAHYPTTSKEQYLLKIYGNSIKFITWFNRGNNEAIHVSKQIMEIEAGHDIYKIANGYGLEDEEEGLEWVDDPIDLTFCKPESLQMKYGDLAATDFIHSLTCIGQLMAIKAYNMEMDLRENKLRPRVLVYGIGISTENMFSGLPDDCINIRAYIDSDQGKRFRMYNRRLVITPDYIKFFQFDKIIISSKKYYDEMKICLLENGIKKEKICGIEYLFDLLIDEENRK